MPGPPEDAHGNIGRQWRGQKRSSQEQHCTILKTLFMSQLCADGAKFETELPASTPTISNRRIKAMPNCCIGVFDNVSVVLEMRHESLSPKLETIQSFWDMKVMHSSDPVHTRGHILNFGASWKVIVTVSLQKFTVCLLQQEPVFGLKLHIHRFRSFSSTLGIQRNLVINKGLCSDSTVCQQETPTQSMTRPESVPDRLLRAQ